MTNLLEVLFKNVTINYSTNKSYDDSVKLYRTEMDPVRLGLGLGLGLG